MAIFGICWVLRYPQNFARSCSSAMPATVVCCQPNFRAFHSTEWQRKVVPLKTRGIRFGDHVAGDHFHDGRAMMKTLVNICIIGLFALMVMSSRGIAQTVSTAEARLKELNITLPSVPPPVANYVNSVRVGNLLFLAGNTAGPGWKYKGKVGKDLRCKKATTPPVRLD